MPKTQNDMEDLKALLDGTPKVPEIIDTVDVEGIDDPDMLDLEDRTPDLSLRQYAHTQFARSGHPTLEEQSLPFSLRGPRIVAAKDYCMHKFKQGYVPKEIAELLAKQYHISRKKALEIVKQADKDIRDAYLVYAKDIAFYNVMALRKIAQDSMRNGQNKTAIEAIKELDKIAHLYENNITVEADAPIKITFNG